MLGFDLGIGITGVLIGAVSLVLSWYFRPHGRLGIQIFDYIPLKDRLTRNLEGIGITYKGSAISNRVVFVKGAIMNIGNLDITSDMVVEDLRFSLASDRWIDVTLGANPGKVEAKIANCDTRFKFDLLKKGEFIAFKALLEWDDGQEVEERTAMKQMMLRTRIVNTTNDSISWMKRSSHRLELFAISSFIGAAIGVGYALAVMSFMIEEQPYVTFQYKLDDDSLVHNVRLMTREDGTVDVVRMLETPRGLHHEVLETFKFDDVFRTEKIPIQLRIDKFERGSVYLEIVIAIGLAMVGLMLWMIAVRKRKRRIVMERLLYRM